MGISKWLLTLCMWMHLIWELVTIWLCNWIVMRLLVLKTLLRLIKSIVEHVHRFVRVTRWWSWFRSQWKWIINMNMELFIGVRVLWICRSCWLITFHSMRYLTWSELRVWWISIHILELIVLGETYWLVLRRPWDWDDVWIHVHLLVVWAWTLITTPS